MACKSWKTRALGVVALCAVVGAFPPWLRAQSASLVDNGGQVYNCKAYGCVGDDTTHDSAAIQATINALPSCTKNQAQGGTTFTHCGEVLLPAGVYYLDAQIAITSPFVTLKGINPGATILDSHVSSSASHLGCAIDWTSSPSNRGQDDRNSGGLFDLTIMGYKAGGTSPCGLETRDINGVKIHDVTIAGFVGTNGSGWIDSARSGFNERFDVRNLHLTDNHVSWYLVNFHTTGTGNTLGYGHFDVFIDTLGTAGSGGQYGIYCYGAASPYKMLFDYATGHIVINENYSGDVGIQLSGASYFNFDGEIHIEGPGTGVNVTSTSEFYAHNIDFSAPVMSKPWSGSGRMAAANFPVTVSELPVCTSSSRTFPQTVNFTAVVSGSKTTTWGATVVGGGTNHVKVWCNGTNWTVYAQ